jgi:molybdopterin-guanine dinucleotide biosynthesis protein A
MLKCTSAIILAGGKARRMQGQDKGLIEFNHKPLIHYAIFALKPQIKYIFISANRNIDVYKKFNLPVISDTIGNYFGPLAGIASALQIITTDYLLVVPCDAPFMPNDLIDRLYKPKYKLVMAHDGKQLQPLFMLIHKSLLSSILKYLQSGQRKLTTWCKQQHHTIIDFSDKPQAFVNVNTIQELSKLNTLERRN